MLEVAAQHTIGAFKLNAAFTAPTPGITALFGPSGSGKTTLLNIVAGLLKPKSGRIALNGATLLDTTRRIDIPPERRRCGVVFQDARLLPHMSVETNLRYGARRAPPNATGPAFEEIVDLLGIAPLLTRRPRALSGGERQRVALGRALLARPNLLLMDEPLAALDTPRKTEILPFLERLRDTAQIPILYVTHALDEVDRLATTLILIEAGQVTAAGPLQDLATRTDLPTLTLRRDAGAVLHCQIESHDEPRGLTLLTFPGGQLQVPLRPEPNKTNLRLRLKARDVAIATQIPTAISSHNILPATITEITPTTPHEVLVTLQTGPTKFLARLTRNAVQTLTLHPGKQVQAMIKSTAFDHP